MTKLQQWWAKIVRVNPGFGEPDDTKVKLTIGAIRKLTARAHKDGFHCGMQAAGSLTGLGKTTDYTAEVLESLARKMRGQ